MAPRESAPITGWDKLPQPGDTSTGADLVRIKWYRNMLAHHEDGKLTPTDFSMGWGELECVGIKVLINNSYIDSKQS